MPGGVVKANASNGNRLLDSPSGRAQSPAWKRRKMHTPVRFRRSSTPRLDDLDTMALNDGEDSRVERPDSTRKALFDTPDSKENSRMRRNVDFGTPERDSDGMLDGMRPSNVNPFYTNLNDSSISNGSAASACPSQAPGQSFARDDSPDATMLFASPGTAHRRRHTRKGLMTHSSSAGSILSDEQETHRDTFRNKSRHRLERESDSDDDNDDDDDDNDDQVNGKAPLNFSSISLLPGQSGDQTARKPLRRRRGGSGLIEDGEGRFGPLFFDAGESPVPVMPSTAKKPAASREAPSTPILPQSPASPCSNQSMSPSDLCNQMKRTCSVSGVKGFAAREMSSGGSRSASSYGSRSIDSPAQTGDNQHDDLIDEEEEIASSVPRRFLRDHATASPLPPQHSPLPARTPCPASTMRGRAARRARGISECSSGGPVVRSRFKEEFEEVGILGTGTFGTVFKCRNRLDGCLYAVKVTKQRFKGRADRERVLKEVFALSALCNEEDSPHIVRYFGAFVEDGRLFIQTELCDKSLQDMIRSETYPNGLEAAARTLARQVLEGLSSLHKHNLVHLDIKPANIFVKNGVFKVGDLGHACLARIQGSEEENPVGGATPASGAGISRTSPALDFAATASQSPLRADSRLPRPPPLGTCSPDKSRRPTSICDASRTPLRRMGSLLSVDASSPSMLMFDSDKKAPRRGQQQEQPAYVQDVEEGDSRYMAMEILNEDYRQLTKGDIFSLGASLYEMCLGHELPANGPEWHDIRAGKLSQEALSRVSPDMQSLIRLMLGKDPVARPSAEALLVSGGPGGILRTAWESQLAREKAAADEYRKELARMKAASAFANAGYLHQQVAGGFDPGSFEDAKYRMRRSNTM
ncbi:Wee1-like protein kinase [Hondaea fermentalgiana]|uniref:Wee1-like protein kinase n=1 Tax=Hondaea fermentalgiana TaxID=2315210 RepID=A0A2R5G011_9STRA|nr:Wee1-like protein kinase [Hondaea fermentalgiana]|eukprot:GBG24357.1 Wee1-like protein kinase [Hondaea fermentalgiana]